MNWHMHWYTNTYRWRLGKCWAGHVFTTCSLFSTECNTPKIVCSMVIGTIRIRIDHPRSLRSWYIKWINQSFPRVDSSVPLIWCLSRSFQLNTHRFDLLCRHLIGHGFKPVEFHVNCFWSRSFSVYCLSSTPTCPASTILTGLSSSMSRRLSS